MEAVDYKSPDPLWFRTDYRTATYRGHRFQPSHEPEFRLLDRLWTPPRALHRNVIRQDHYSETHARFPRHITPLDDFQAAALTFQSDRPQFITRLAEKTRTAPLLRPIDASQTVTFRDFTPKQSPGRPYVTSLAALAARHVSPPIETSNLGSISTANTHSAGGFTRHLDHLASTTTLDIVPYPPETQLGIVGRKDALTFWDWHDYPKTQLGFGLPKPPTRYRAKAGPIYDVARFRDPITDRRLPHRPAFVPHAGLRSETGAQFSVTERRLESDLREVFPIVVPPTGLGIGTDGSENGVYGSGERLHSYLSGARRPEVTYRRSIDFC